MVWVGSIGDVGDDLLPVIMRIGVYRSGTDHSDADIASSSGSPAKDEDEVLAENLGYEHGFEGPENGGPFLGEYGVDFSIRIVWASHDGRSMMVAESCQCRIRHGAKVLS